MSTWSHNVRPIQTEETNKHSLNPMGANFFTHRFGRESTRTN